MNNKDAESSLTMNMCTKKKRALIFSGEEQGNDQKCRYVLDTMSQVSNKGIGLTPKANFLSGL
jgi:hypothetical protein